MKQIIKRRFKLNRLLIICFIFFIPCVPYTESEQIVESLRKRNAPVEYKLFDDEGHGVNKLKNRLVVYPLVADFLDKHLSGK